MTESEWLTSEDPGRMLERVTPDCDCMVRQSPGRPRLTGLPHLPGCRHLGDRKARLFACACVREHWRLLGAECQRAVETAEAFADGEATKEETFRLASSRMTIARCLMPTWNSSEEATAVIETARMHNTAILPTYACLLREIVGNPLRPVTLERPLCKACGGRGEIRFCDAAGDMDDEPCKACGGSLAGGYRRGTGRQQVSWLTPTVVEMAHHAYDSRDFVGLPVLADALEEAGCDNEHVLRHLRGEELVPSPHMPSLGLWRPLRNPHVRGCWVLDLILGES